jgi:hypothetical protein
MSLALIPIYDDDRIISVEHENNARPRVGVALRVGSMFARSYSHQDWWQTTLITEITDEWEDTDEAEEKYRAYWEAKDDPYSVSYHVYDLEIKEAIQ